MESDKKLSKKRLMEIKKENDEKRYNLFFKSGDKLCKEMRIK